MLLFISHASQYKQLYLKNGRTSVDVLPFIRRKNTTRYAGAAEEVILLPRK